jgi:hypothetical protein
MKGNKRNEFTAFDNVAIKFNELRFDFGAKVTVLWLLSEHNCHDV